MAWERFLVSLGFSKVLQTPKIFNIPADLSSKLVLDNIILIISEYFFSYNKPCNSSSRF